MRGDGSAFSARPVTYFDTLTGCFNSSIRQYHRLSNKLLCFIVTNRNRTGAPASAIPQNRLVHVKPEWRDSFQVVYLSAFCTGDGLRHGVTSFDLHSS